MIKFAALRNSNELQYCVPAHEKGIVIGVFAWPIHYLIMCVLARENW